jgi:nicotinamidase-related amidase
MNTIPILSQANSSFVFIDLQEKLLIKIPESERLVSRCGMLLDTAKILSIPTLVTTQYRKGLGEVTAGFAARVAGEVKDKTSFSCAGDSAIDEELMMHRRPWVVVAGIETHICVMQTVLDLMRRGRQVAVVADAVGTRSQTDHQYGLKRMENSGALLVTVEMLIYELLGRSDSADFKKLLPLIKSNL